MAKVLKTTLAEKFPDATENEVYKASVVSHPPPLALSFAPMVPVNHQTDTKGQKTLCCKNPRRKIFSTLSVEPGSPAGLR